LVLDLGFQLVGEVGAGARHETSLEKVRVVHLALLPPQPLLLTRTPGPRPELASMGAWAVPHRSCAWTEGCCSAALAPMLPGRQPLDAAVRKNFRVRRSVVHSWLLFLKANNPFYHHIEINSSAFDALPEDSNDALNHLNPLSSDVEPSGDAPGEINRWFERKNRNYFFNASGGVTDGSVTVNDAASRGAFGCWRAPQKMGNLFHARMMQPLGGHLVAGELHKRWEIYFTRQSVKTNKHEVHSTSQW
jgi:hypothetical protein